jgi:hypothetical protein
MTRSRLSASLLALGILGYLAFLFSPFTNAAAGANVMIPGWLFLGWGPGMARSELLHGTPLFGLTLALVYTGSASLLMSPFVHRSRPIRLTVMCGSPLVLASSIVLFAYNVHLGRAPWGALVYCAAIGFLGARAFVLHYMPE